MPRVGPVYHILTGTPCHTREYSSELPLSITYVPSFWLQYTLLYLGRVVTDSSLTAITSATGCNNYAEDSKAHFLREWSRSASKLYTSKISSLFLLGATKHPASARYSLGIFSVPLIKNSSNKLCSVNVLARTGDFQHRQCTASSYHATLRG